MMALPEAYYLADVRPRWRTPDAAIREAIEHSPLRARGIDYARIPGPSEESAIAREAISQVYAILGALDEREEIVIVGRAFRLSYEQIAKAAEEAGIEHLSASTAHRIGRQVWPRVRDRLVELGLVER